MTHSIQCTCGKLKGNLNHTRSVSRCVCYCQDCQAFAHFLKCNHEILDKMGGTEIIQTTPTNITFTKGFENLACMRLTAKGLLRWYAACCNTPIGNTPANFKISFIGLIHNCLSPEQGSLDEAFGPIQMRVHTQYAKGEPKQKSGGVAAGIFRVTGMILKARLNGSYKHNPFFSPESGAPIVTPKLLSTQELKEVMSTV